MELISVILPVYNTVNFLDECIQSVLNQTYSEWELIIVDDGSTDGSSKICDMYGEQDERIHVFHKENGGQSSARNIALKNCNGKYYMFLDSDDKLETNAMKSLYECLKHDSADMACGGIKSFGQTKIKYVYINDENQIWNGEIACKKMFSQDGVDSNTFAKLYKAELWQNIFFPEGTIFEDVPIMYKIFLNCERVSKYKDCVYEQRVREGSTTKSEFKETKKIYTKYAYDVYKDVSNIKPSLKAAAYIYYLYSVVDNFINLSCSRNCKEHKEYWLSLKTVIKGNKNIIFREHIFRSRLSQIICCYFRMGRVCFVIKNLIKETQNGK